MQVYRIINILLWLVILGAVFWKAGWLAAAGLFLVLFINHRTVSSIKTPEQLEEEQAARELAHIRSDPERFGDDPFRTRYF